MKNLLCLLGLHKWVEREEWLPSVYAPVVTRVTFFRECSACKKQNNVVMSFDEENKCMKKKSIDRIILGQTIALEGNTRIKVASAANQKEVVIGIAIHNIEIGEIVDFEPNQNTKDIAAISSGILRFDSGILRFDEDVFGNLE